MSFFVAGSLLGFFFLGWLLVRQRDHATGRILPAGLDVAFVILGVLLTVFLFLSLSSDTLSWKGKIGLWRISSPVICGEFLLGLIAGAVCRVWCADLLKRPAVGSPLSIRTESFWLVSVGGLLVLALLAPIAENVARFKTSWIELEFNSSERSAENFESLRILFAERNLQLFKEAFQTIAIDKHLVELSDLKKEEKEHVKESYKKTQKLFEDDLFTLLFCAETALDAGFSMDGVKSNFRPLALALLAQMQSLSEKNAPGSENSRKNGKNVSTAIKEGLEATGRGLRELASHTVPACREIPLKFAIADIQNIPQTPLMYGITASMVAAGGSREKAIGLLRQAMGPKTPSNEDDADKKWLARDPRLPTLSGYLYAFETSDMPRAVEVWGIALQRIEALLRLEELKPKAKSELMLRAHLLKNNIAYLLAELGEREFEARAYAKQAHECVPKTLSILDTYGYVTLVFSARSKPVDWAGVREAATILETATSKAKSAYEKTLDDEIEERPKTVRSWREEMNERKRQAEKPSQEPAKGCKPMPAPRAAGLRDTMRVTELHLGQARKLLRASGRGE